MSNGAAHRFVSGAGVTALAAAEEYNRTGQVSSQPLFAGAIASATATLPDMLEPALGNPNHRQFFHGFVFAGVVGYGLYKLYKWQPDKDSDKLVRFVALAVGASYLIHLVCDSGTPKGLPVVGNI